LEGLRNSLLPKNRVIATLSSSETPSNLKGLEELTDTLSINVDHTSEKCISDANVIFLSLPGLSKIVTSKNATRERIKEWYDLKVRCCVEDGDAELLGGAFGDIAKTDRPDKLYTTVVTTRSGIALGLVYSSKASIIAALQSGRGVYYSRSRGGLWRKGDTSGCYQILHRIDLDCDGDAVRFMVTQMGEVPAFCHLNTLTCWGNPNGITHLEEVLKDRLVNAVEGSYTRRLFEDGELLRNKMVEEAQELSEAEEKRHIAEELADVLYFAMVRAVKGGVSIDDAVKVLDERSRKVTRRPGNDKKERIEAAAKILEGAGRKGEGK